MDARNLRRCPDCQELTSAKRTYIRERNDKGKYYYKPIGYFFPKHSCNGYKYDAKAFVEIEKELQPYYGLDKSVLKPVSEEKVMDPGPTDIQDVPENPIPIPTSKEQVLSLNTTTKKALLKQLTGNSRRSIDDTTKELLKTLNF